MNIAEANEMPQMRHRTCIDCPQVRTLRKWEKLQKRDRTCDGCSAGAETGQISKFL